jgi:hypothetical protein
MSKLEASAKALLKEHKSITAAVNALAAMLKTDGELRVAIASNYLTPLSNRRKKETPSRRREGPHRSPMPSKAQKAGALAAEKIYTKAIFDKPMRGGRRLGDIRINDLHAIAEASATTATSFLQRGYDDAVETFLCIMLSKHCVTADPFVTVEEAIKPGVVTTIMEKAKISAAELLRDGGAKMARDLVAAAHVQEIGPPSSP